MVQPGPLVDQAMWVAIRVVLQVLGSWWLGSGASVARWYSKPRGWVSKLPPGRGLVALCKIKGCQWVTAARQG
jgi:hypothetical protein